MPPNIKGLPKTSHNCTYVYVCTYVRTYITVSACMLLCVAQSAATKAIVEAQLIRRLSQRPTKGELQDRNILKG